VVALAGASLHVGRGSLLHGVEVVVGWSEVARVSGSASRFRRPSACLAIQSLQPVQEVCMTVGSRCIAVIGPRRSDTQVAAQPSRLE